MPDGTVPKILLDLFYVSIWERAHGEHFGKDWPLEGY